MTNSKHPKGGMHDDKGLGSDTPRPPDDLERDPGIKRSKGVFGSGQDPSVLDGEHTFEGDVKNDTTPQGGVNPGQLGRTNK